MAGEAVASLLRSRPHDARMSANFAALGMEYPLLRPQLARLAEGANVDVCATDLADQLLVPTMPAYRTMILPNLRACVADVAAAARVGQAANYLRRTAFDQENHSHCCVLVAMGHLLLPHRAVDSAHSPDWPEAGFQSSRPGTDFRATGLLGLLQLRRFAMEHTATARQILAKTCLPYRGYPLALVSIHMTAFVCDLLAQRLLDEVLADLRQCSSIDMPGSERVDLEQDTADATCRPVHWIHSVLMLSWDVAWWENPPADLMGFPAQFKRFSNAVTAQLRPGCSAAGFTHGLSGGHAVNY
jgi:hypothetical protein